MMSIKLPVVSNCAVADCSFNQDGCAAAAMTMGAQGCSTFISLPEKAKNAEASATVGACQKVDCSYNDHLECSAQAVKVGGESGECLTFHPVA